MLMLLSSSAPPPIGLEEGVSIIAEKSGGLEKFIGMFMSGMAGEKVFRLEANDWVVLLGVKSVVKGFVSEVVVLGGGGAGGAALSCGTSWIVSLAAAL